MAERDYDSFLAALRLHREQIEEAMLVIERLVKTEKSSNKQPAWAKEVTEDKDPGARDHITYKDMMHTLQENRAHVQEAILAIEKLARGRAATSTRHALSKTSKTLGEKKGKKISS